MKLKRIYDTIGEGVSRSSVDGVTTFQFNFEVDESTDIALLAKPEPAQKVDAVGVTCLAAFSPTARYQAKKQEKADLRAQRAQKRSHPSDEELNSLNDVVAKLRALSGDDNDSNAVKKAITAIYYNNVLQKIDYYILSLTFPRLNLSAAGETKEQLKRFDGISDDSIEFLKDFKQSFLSNKNLLDFFKTGAATQESLLRGNIQRYLEDKRDGAHVPSISDLADSVQKIASQLSDISSKAKSYKETNEALKSEVDNVRKAESNISSAYTELGRYVGNNINSQEIKKFIAVGVQQLKATEEYNRVQLVIPVPGSSGAIDGTVRALLTGLGKPVADILERDNFIVDQNRLRDLIAGSRYWYSMERDENGKNIKIPGEAAAKMDFDMLAGMQLGNDFRRGFDTTVQQLISRVQRDRGREGRFPSLSKALNPDSRQIVTGGYNVQANSDDALQVVSVIESGGLIWLVDDNAYSGTSISLCYSAVSKLCSDYNINMPSESVMGCVLLSNKRLS
jgi:hypothetical protein